MPKIKAPEAIEKEKKARIAKYGFDFNEKATKEIAIAALNSNIKKYEKYINACSKRIKLFEAETRNEILKGIKNDIDSGKMTEEEINNMVAFLGLKKE